MATQATARTAALALLLGVTEERRALSALSGEDGPLARLEDPGERARAQRLAAETLRHLSRADTLLAARLRRRPPPPVRGLLRLATVEMLVLGAAPHGVVDSAVAAARADRRMAHAAGLVNAVLRQVAGEGDAWRALPPQPLPGWLRGRLLSAYGARAVAAIERAHAGGAPLDLTPRRSGAAALAAAVGGTVLPTGSVRLDAGTRVTGLPGYAEGRFWVQDAAAAVPARILAPAPGERVADLCAAPGGKTLQLADAGAEVTAVEVSPQRAARLRENLARTGLSAGVVIADARDWAPEAAPSAILLDAPCSATGTIRRHPDLPFIREAAGLGPLVTLQAALLDRSVSLLPPGGRLLYSTCSLLPEEGERQVAAALARHADLVTDPEALLVEGVDPAWRTAEGGLRLRPDYWPERGGMDGFYIALLRRRGVPREGHKTSA